MAEPLRLHIGCGERKLAGFIDMDLEGDNADMILDVTRGLPFPDASVDCIFGEHFIEHLTHEDSIRFLADCYRVLRAGGVCRVATPDLAHIVRSYTADIWRKDEWIKRFGYEWIGNRSVMLNVALREWGNQHVFDYDDLRSVAALAGFLIAHRCEPGMSKHDALAGLEHREGSFVKVRGLPVVLRNEIRHFPDPFRRIVDPRLADELRNVPVKNGNRDPHAAAGSLDPVAVAPVPLRVLHVVVIDEQIDGFDKIEIAPPGNEIGLGDPYLHQSTSM